MAKRTKATAPVANADTSIDTLPTTEQGVETPVVSDDDILAALEAADGGTKVEDTTEETVAQIEAVEEIEVTLEDRDEDAILAELEAEEDNAAPAPKTKSSKTKTPKQPKAPAAPTRAFCDVADHMDDAALKAALDSINAKKVHEKAQNMVQAITTGKKLSGFTQLAVKKLLADGRISGKSLVEAYQADGKSLGTARAQSQQMTALFKALGIAQPDPSNPRELVPASNGLVRELEQLAA